jgi:hypothetical protein
MKLVLIGLIMRFKYIILSWYIHGLFLNLNHEQKVIICWKCLHLSLYSFFFLLIFNFSYRTEHWFLCYFETVLFFLLNVVSFSRQRTASILMVNNSDINFYADFRYYFFFNNLHKIIFALPSPPIIFCDWNPMIVHLRLNQIGTWKNCWK